MIVGMERVVNSPKRYYSYRLKACVRKVINSYSDIHIYKICQVTGF